MSISRPPRSRLNPVPFTVSCGCTLASVPSFTCTLRYSTRREMKGKLILCCPLAPSPSSVPSSPPSPSLYFTPSFSPSLLIPAHSLPPSSSCSLLLTHDGSNCANSPHVIEYDVMWSGVEGGLSEQTIVESSCSERETTWMHTPQSVSST